MIPERITRAFELRLYAGEAIDLELQLLDAAGAVQPLAGRSFVLTLFRADRTTASSAGALLTVGADAAAAFHLPGSASEALLGKAGVRWEMAELLADGREVQAGGPVMVSASAAAVATSSAAPGGSSVTRITRQLVANRPRLVVTERGARGVPNAIGIGNVTTRAPGAAATAGLRGEAPSQLLDLGIPAGATGATPALAIGTVTTTPAGGNAAASLRGTAEAPILDFAIPRGADATGVTGGFLLLPLIGGSADLGSPVTNNGKLARFADAGGERLAVALSGSWRILATAAAGFLPGFDFSGGVLPPGAALARATTGWRTGPGGLLVPEAANVARFDHDPATSALRGLLIEPAATNLLVRSTELASAAWAKSAGTTIADASATGPAGANTASVVTDPNASGFCNAMQVLGGQTNTVYSIYLAKDAVPKTTRFVCVRVAAPGNMDVFLDTSTGEIVAQNATIFGIETVGAFYRVWVASTGAIAGAYVFPAVGAGSAMGTANFQAAVTGSATVWGAQVEAGTKPSSPIVTGASSATRAADVLTLNWANQGVPDGAITVRYTFDDASTQDVPTTVAGGVAVVPTNLNRPRLRRAEKV